MRCLNALSALLVLAIMAAAQDSDTFLTRDTPQLTLLSQVSDSAESNAFLRAYQAGDAMSRHEYAHSFIDLYPRSFLLAQAFDLAAKASIDLGQYPQAIDEGRFSLRLMPENAPLLVLLANVEARQPASFLQALADARDALEYLDQFEPPGSLNEADGKRLYSQLRASAWYATALVCVSRGLTTPLQPAELTQALSALDRAAAWNSSDPEIFYLRGVVAFALHQTAEAESDLAFAAQSSESVAPRASKYLREIFQKIPGTHGTFEQFVVSRPAPMIDPQLRASPQSKPSAAMLAGYAGPAVCAECHSHEYETWRKTGMARMLRPFQPENILGDFSASASFEDTAIRFGVSGRPFFDISDDEGSLHRYQVDYTIGSKWQQAYATALPDGRLQVLPIQYNRLTKSWVNYWSIIDPAGSPRAVVTRFPELLPESNYQRNCAICHTSQLRAVSSKPDSFEHATFLEPGVDCEMCHGPSALHVRQARVGEINRDDLPVDFRKIDHREGVRICGQCHRQSATRQLGTAREMNFSTSTGSFAPVNLSRPYDAFSRRAFYADGRFRETTFIVEAFTRSACYRRGSAQCANCHAPHVPDPEHNQTSLKFGEQTNELCLNCHFNFRSQIDQHTHHLASSEGAQCVACHMPRIVNALLFQARSHQIEIPTADLTERFGQVESPNACLVCHKDRDTGWLSNQLNKWRQIAVNK